MMTFPMPNVIVIGAGITGLSAAWHLRQRGVEGVLVLDRSHRVGGVCQTDEVKVKGVGTYLFDWTGHVLHLRNEEVKKVLRPYLARCARKERRAWIWFRGTLIPYPFQGNLASLPPAVAGECLTEFLRAWAARPEGYGRDSPQAARPLTGDAPSKQDFGQWIEAAFGRGIAKHFMTPYNTKLWRVPPRRLTCEWMGSFVPTPSLEEVLRPFVSADGTGNPPMGYNATFWYPTRGGIATFAQWLALQVGHGHIRLSQGVRSIDPHSNTLTTHAGTSLPYDALISTAPLPALVRMLTSCPLSIRRAAARLRWTSVTVFHLALTRPMPKDRHWIYIPDPRYPFYRLGYPCNQSRHHVPEGRGSISVECSHRPGTRVEIGHWQRRVITALIKMGILRSPREVLKVHVTHVPFAYVIFDRTRTAAVRDIQAWLTAQRIFSAGRYGGWEYSYMEKNFLDGQRAADMISLKGSAG